MKLLTQSFLSPLCVSGLALGSIAFAQPAKVAQEISLRYQGSEVNVTLQDLESFTDTGILPTSLQDLLGTDAAVPPAIRTLLSKEIRVPNFVEDFLESSTGEFVLSQLDDTIRSTTGDTEQDLFALKSAFNIAAQDDRMSFIELVRVFPQSNVSVDLTNLEGTYNRVSNFVERVQPALEVAKGFLSDIICDCNTTARTTSAPKAAVTASRQPCQNSVADTSSSTQALSSEKGERSEKESLMKVSQSAQ